MTLFRRRAAAPPPRPRIPISTPDPADEVRRLGGLIEDLRLVIGTLADEVGQLRCRFADVGRTTSEPVEPAAPLCPLGPIPDIGPIPDTTGDPVVDVARLGAVFDLLHERADALWFERQWLAAQIDVAQTTLGRAATTPRPAGQSPHRGRVPNAGHRAPPDTGAPGPI